MFSFHTSIAGLVKDQILQRTEDRIVPKMVGQLVEVPKMMSHSEQIVDPPAPVFPERISPNAELVHRGGQHLEPRPELAAHSEADYRRLYEHNSFTSYGENLGGTRGSQNYPSGASLNGWANRTG